MSIQIDAFINRNHPMLRRTTVSMDTFERACREADRKAAARPRDHRLERLRRLLEDEVSLERAWRELNDVRNRSTPKATIDAVWWAICERGMSALAEPRIADRIANFDEAARSELDRRIANIGV